MINLYQKIYLQQQHFRIKNINTQLIFSLRFFAFKDWSSEFKPNDSLVYGSLFDANCFCLIEHKKTLEWLLTSPPPFHTFTTPPHTVFFFDWRNGFTKFGERKF